MDHLLTQMQFFFGLSKSWTDDFKKNLKYSSIMPIGKVKVHNVRGGAEVKGPSNAFAKLSALGGASTKQQALDEQQASLLNNVALICGRSSW